jgi:hypothetical protein
LAETEATVVPGRDEDQDGEGGGGETGGDDSTERIAPTSGARLSIELRAGKTEVFDALRILPALADESDTMDVSISIAATAKEKYDRTWVRNAVREPLDEAGIDGQVEILEGDGQSSLD